MIILKLDIKKMIIPGQGLEVNQGQDQGNFKINKF